MPGILNLFKEAFREGVERVIREKLTKKSGAKKITDHGLESCTGGN